MGLYEMRITLINGRKSQNCVCSLQSNIGNVNYFLFLDHSDTGYKHT